MPTLLRVYLAVRRFLLIHRRGLAAGCLGLAAWLALEILRPAPPPTVELWAAGRDLVSGTVLSADDLHRTAFPPGARPVAAIDDLGTALGRTLTTPLGRGEVLTTHQVIGDSGLAGYPGSSAIGLRIPDADAATLLHHGDRVDLVASDPQGTHPPEMLVRDAVVLTAPRTGAEAGSPTSTGLLVVFAVPTKDVVHIASSASTLFLTPIWNR